MVVMNSFIYNLNEGKVEYAEREKFDNKTLKTSIEGMEKLDYQEIKFGNTKMFIKYNSAPVSMRTMSVIIFEELETETDVLDETLDDLYNEIEDDLNEVIDDEFVKLWTNMFG